MKKIIVANWKMQLLNSEAKALALNFFEELKDSKNNIVICPDYLSLVDIARIIKESQFLLGAQDLAAYDRGAYTGEISAESLKELGVSYVIIGHSERRSYLQESDKLISEKIKKAIKNKLIPILCVGENAAERKQGRANMVIRRQLKGALSSLKSSELSKLHVAYEPIWAIGSGRYCDAEQARSIKSLIIDCCLKLGVKKVKVLYGGSANIENAKSFLFKASFSGLLVGGASLELDSFRQIVNL
ncbi:MAG: triose-phosphate isomerase [Clostridia bacterium]|nr:triose-phosphate isomerase [Clostridia bacterium]